MSGDFAMKTLWPSVQEGTGAVEAVEEVPADPPPLLDGPKPALWVGFGVGLLVFFLVMMAIIRGRVVRPAQRKSFDPDTNFFEPAGDDADITFEEPASEDLAPKKRGWFSRKPKPDESKEGSHQTHHFEDTHDPNEAEITIERPDDALEANAAPDSDDEKDAPAEKKRGRSPFAGLFKKKQDEPAEPVEPAAEPAPDEASVVIETADAAPPPVEDDGRDHDTLSAPVEDSALRQAEADAAEARRHAALEIAEARRREEEAAEAARHEAQARERAETDAALAARESALESRFTALSQQLENRIANAARQTAQAAPLAAVPQTGPQLDSRLVALIEQEFSALRASLDASITDINQRLDVTAASPDGAAALSKQIADLNRLLGEHTTSAAAAKVQLSDLVQNALPPNAYVFQKKLANGRTADCAVDLPHAHGDIAIDAQFPVEAFDRYIRERKTYGNEEKAENEFRSAVLRHVVSVSEKYIVPGETATSALMFIPSETIYGEIQARFPDLVQDSYNARVWIVSPTSLMATLHTIRELLRDSRGAEPPSDAPFAEEIAALRERVQSLEKYIESSRQSALAYRARSAGFDAFEDNEATRGASGGQAVQAAADAGAGAHSLSPEEEAFERLEREEALSEARERAAAQSINRPPFPLR